MTNKTVIQCATPPEFDALRTAFDGIEVERFGKRSFFYGSSAKGLGDCLVLRGSVGKVWAAASAEFAISHWSPCAVVDFGAAGGLRSELKVGDLVLADEIVEHDVRNAWDGKRPLVRGKGDRFATWFEGVPEFPQFKISETGGGRITRGCIAAGDQDIQTPSEREELAKATGAIAATWESSAVGRVCELHSVPFISVRVITDLGTDELRAEYKQGIAKALLPAAKTLASWLRSSQLG